MESYAKDKIRRYRIMLLGYAFGCVYTMIALGAFSFFYLLGVVMGSLAAYAALNYYYGR